ncbi:MAG: DnaJ domain-containing protein [Symploca sp. SIO1A3]|nr:DnaJ domain-containing protein [Symploca sp. SIO1A3]
MNNLDRCYRLLGLEPGASPEEVNQAYKDLAFIWHPDRIPEDNHRLRQKAQEKLKEINQARDQLRALEKTTPAPRRKAQPSSQSARRRTYYQPKRAYYQPRTQTHYQPRTPHPDLSGADFQGADLKEKDLSGRNLSNANLSKANLSDAFLHKVNLEGANLEGANLFRANLLQANLRNACLKDANLIGADFSGADLSSADLTGAKVGSKDRVLVKLTGTKLSGAILPDGTICN